MDHRYTTHYTLDEARVLLPQVRQWLAELRERLQAYQQLERRLASLGSAGHDLGGASVNDWFRQMTRVAEAFGEFHRREIQIKDIERGLVDFPALRGDREIFLCWEEDEEDIQHWHDLDSGYAGRHPI